MKKILYIILFLAVCILTSYDNPIFSDESPSSTPDSLFNQAISLYYKGDFPTSLEKLQQIVSDNPDNTAARLSCIRLLREEGKYHDALLHLNYLLKKAPSNPGLNLELIQITYLSGDPASVIALARNNPTSSETLYWEGLALADVGNIAESIQALESSLAIQPFNPMANYKLGLLYLKNQNYEEAQKLFLRSLTQDPNLTIIHYPLSQTYLGLQKFKSAYNLLLKAQSASPWNQSVNELLKSLVLTHPELAKERQEEEKKRREVAAPPKVTSIMGRDTIPEIRIGLVEKAMQMYVKTGDDFLLKERDGERNISGTPGTVLLFRRNENLVEVMDAQETVLLKTSRPIVLSYANPGATTALFDVAFGEGSFWAGREDRIYRGQIEITLKKDGLTIVNRLNVEEYLYSVVPSEMSAGWPAAALEAQAIAARTYAFANMGQFESRGFDLMATVVSQVYSGVRGEAPAATAAVNATRGTIVAYNGKPIAAFFTGNSGGFSEGSRSVWNYDIPYLQAVPDQTLPRQDGVMSPEDLAIWLFSSPETYSSNPKYSARSSYRWTIWPSREELEARLNLGEKLGKIVNIITAGRGSSGRVERVLVKGTAGEITVKGDAIRSKLGGLRSNLFVIEPKLGADGLPEYFVITGGGWGHGVGMCQSGAAGMAAAGYSYKDILGHYYPGTEIVKKY